jgi:hypothetical protein
MPAMAEESVFDILVGADEDDTDKRYSTFDLINGGD